MPAARKPKKVFIQFAIAAAIAAVLGIGALVAGLTIITNITTEAEKTKEEALAQAKAAEEEKARLLREQMQKEQEPSTFKIVQAMADIASGQVITREMLTVSEVPDRPESGSLHQLSQAVGKMAKVRITKGETLERSKLLDTSGLISVEAGMRAITIQVDGIGGLNGGLAPGARVDILATVDKDGKTMTRTLLQNIQVISSGGNSSAPSVAAKAGEMATQAIGGGGGEAVTVSVTPKQAELLTLANQMGKFHLTLRNFNDKTTAKVSGADLTALMTGQQPSSRKLPPRPSEMVSSSGFHNVNYSPDQKLPGPTGPEKAASKFSMQIYRGTGTETVDFQQ